MVGFQTYVPSGNLVITKNREVPRRSFILAGLNKPEATRYAVVIVPFLFGLYAVYLGADSNWDLYNYHRYGPFALLNGKIGMDLGVGGFQGYFNPFLDFLPYWLNEHLPSRLSAFLQGCMHGLAFVLVLGIARQVLTALAPEDQHRLPILLALAGCLTANFRSEVGNGMGDNTTAVLVLSAVYLIVSQWKVLDHFDTKAICLLFLSGILVGLAVGLKLTNGTSALAICLSLLVCGPGATAKRIWISFLFGVAVLAGFSVSGGIWMFMMWKEFGNPLFPQFGNLFPNPLAQPMSVADTRWLPHGIIEYATWPFILSINSRRVGELHVWQIIWSVVYVFFIAWICQALWRRLARRRGRPMDARSRFIVVFVSSAFFIWMIVFSIYRYTVAFEVLAPLATFILIFQLYPYLRARRICAWVLTVATAIVVLGGRTWGHEGWGHPLYHTNLTALEQPERATVLLVSKTYPLGWLSTLFPAETVFLGVESSFPATEVYADRVRETARNRGGPIYVFTNGEDNRRALEMRYYNDMASRLGLTRTPSGCDFLQSVVDRMHFRVTVDLIENSDQLCRIGDRPSDVIDVDLSNRNYMRFASEAVATYGFEIEANSCKPFTAGIGSGKKAFQYCRAKLR